LLSNLFTTVKTEKETEMNTEINQPLSVALEQDIQYWYDYCQSTTETEVQS
jgi:hypothetical protein